MDPNQDPSINQPVAPYPQGDFPPPPAESGSGRSQEIPLEGLRFHANQPPPQSTGLNVPTVDVIPPTPSSQATTTTPQPPVQQPPAELSSYSMEEEQAPPLPQRPVPDTQEQVLPPRGNSDIPDVLPPPPPGPPPPHKAHQKAFTNTPQAAHFAPPPQRYRQSFGDDDPSNPIHYTRDPHKLVAYLVPFPVPQLTNAPASSIPPRFLIYTPPPPPLHKPSADEKEGLVHKVQRKWQSEVKSAKTNREGMRSKLTRGVSKAMTYTTSSNLDFLGRVSPSTSKPSSRSPSPAPQASAESLPPADPMTHKTVGVEEMVLLFPSTMNLTSEQMREEFVNTMLRTKSKATRDSVIATGLLPISFGIDILAGPM